MNHYFWQQIGNAETLIRECLREASFPPDLSPTELNELELISSKLHHILCIGTAVKS